VTDPFFWIVSRTTGDAFAQVIRRYTIPLALCGAALYLVALGMQLVVSGV